MIRYLLLSILCLFPPLCRAQQALRETPLSSSKGPSVGTTSKVESLPSSIFTPTAPPIVADPARYNAERLQVYNDLHDFQIKDLISRVGILESTRTWIIGLTAGLGIGIALVVWLRKDIIRSLVTEAFPSDKPIDNETLPERWHPSTSQWVVLWIATVILSALCWFVPWSLSLSLRSAAGSQQVSNPLSSLEVPCQHQKRPIAPSV